MKHLLARKEMQEPSLILSILLAVAMIAMAFVAVRAFKSQRHHSNRNVDTPSSPKSSIAPKQSGNQEPSTLPNAIPPAAHITIPTLIEDEIDSKENKTETSNGNLEEKAQGRITEFTAVSPIETGSGVSVGRDNVKAANETVKDEDHEEPELVSSPEKLESVLTDSIRDSQEVRTKEKGDFRGAPIGQRDKIPRESPRTEEAYKRLKPETVCWRREGRWIIGIEILTECFSEDIQEVRQGANKMLREESRDQCWRLESLTDPLEVTWGNENNRNIDQVLINAEPYGIFKLTGSDQAKGRLVKRISYGAYLLVVPSAWSFKEGMADQDIVEESLSIEKGKAYYCRFEQGREARFTFVDENGKSWPFEAKSPLFELVGTTLEDANDDMGLLFGTGPPSVRIKGHRSWKEIACVVVIQQGIEPGEDRFKDKIISPADDTELSLGSNLQTQSSGWYSLRFYDNKQDSPIETLDFRFVSAIDKITIHQNYVLPARSGHQEITVELAHKPNCSIKLAAPTNSSIVIKKEINHTIVVIPPKPEADESSWFLGTENGPHVRATFLAERIWWTISDEVTEPNEWQDKPAVLKREDFNSSAHKALWVRIPEPGWVDRVYADFSVSNPRHFLIKADQRIKKISLDNFYDTEAISNKGVARDLLIQVQENHHRISAVVGRLPAEKIHVEKPIQQSLQTIDARAACNGGRVFYGNCRHCRAMLKEKNYGSH